MMIMILEILSKEHIESVRTLRARIAGKVVTTAVS